MQPGRAGAGAVLRLLLSGVRQDEDPPPGSQGAIRQFVQLLLPAHKHVFPFACPVEQRVKRRAVDEGGDGQDAGPAGQRTPGALLSGQSEQVKLDGILEPPGARKPGPPGLSRQSLHRFRNSRLQYLSGQIRQCLQEISQWSARLLLSVCHRRGFARQRNIPGAVEGQVPRQDRHPQQWCPVFGDEPSNPYFGVKYAAVGGVGSTHGMHARFEQRVQRSFLAGNRDAGLVDEDVNAVTGLP